MMRIAVLGAGAWGSALALQLVRAGNQVALWTHRWAQAQQAEASGLLPSLAAVPMPGEMAIHHDLAQALHQVDGVLIAVPSHAFADILVQLQAYHLACPVAWATKGFAGDTPVLLHKLVEQLLPQVSATVLSGPTFAAEVAKSLPTALVAASRTVEAAEWWAERLHAAAFRVYTNTDIVGVEVGGAVKNVMAIAAGVSDGLGFGANARAALIARALAEIMRLGVCLGANPDTLMGLAGLGDLVLTCTDNQSRNRRFGMALAQGMSVLEAEVKIGTVEGISACQAVVQVASAHALDMPIVFAVHDVLQGRLQPQEAVMQLLARAPKAE